MLSVRTLAYSFSPTENPDWGFARTCRVALRRPQGEWCSSIFSARFSVPTPFGKSAYVTPNRDFRYEGLLAVVNNENWKFLDAVAIGILSTRGVWLHIEPQQVTVYPWKAVYQYQIKDTTGDRLADLDITYYLMHNLTSEGIVLEIRSSIKWKTTPETLTIVIDPLVDIRHMYDPSSTQSYESHSDKHYIETGMTIKALHVSKDGKTMIIGANADNTSIILDQRTQMWNYKLGQGFRKESNEGVVFEPATETLFMPGLCVIKIPPSKETAILVACGATSKAMELLKDALGRCQIDEEEEIRELETISQTFQVNVDDEDISKALSAHVITLTKFGINVKNIKTNQWVTLPEAGAWWFRTPWLRDTFEGLLHNLNTILSLPHGAADIKSVLLATLSYQDPLTGRLPNRLPTYNKDYITLAQTGRLPEKLYNAADTTLLHFILTSEFINLTKDKDVAIEAAHGLLKALLHFKDMKKEMMEGPPVITGEGLVLCVPTHSWTDAGRTVKHNNIEVQNLPLRIPIEWQREAIERYKDHLKVSSEFRKSKFYLPEINAQWIKTLEAGVYLTSFISKNVSKTHVLKEEINQLKNICEDLLRKAKKNYRKVFWNHQNSFLYNVLSDDLKKRDATEGSPAVVAIALLLLDIFTIEELRKIWDVIKSSLLVYRKITRFTGGVKPFGILVKNSSERIYYNDSQYHEAVVWPRDTPYLIKILEKLGETKIINDLLINNLDHQVTEGAIFYTQELFSLPNGRNPSPNLKTAQNPVPVKNPIQWWSHWTDPYFRCWK